MTALPGRIAVALTRDDPPEILLAEDEHVLSRLVALRLVARTPAASLGEHLDPIRAALLEERWDDAVAEWMEVTGRVLDAYPDEEIWTDVQLDQQRVLLEIRMAPIFE